MKNVWWIRDIIKNWIKNRKWNWTRFDEKKNGVWYESDHHHSHFYWMVPQCMKYYTPDSLTNLQMPLFSPLTVNNTFSFFSINTQILIVRDKGKLCWINDFLCIFHQCGRGVRSNYPSPMTTPLPWQQTPCHTLNFNIEISSL